MTLEELKKLVKPSLAETYYQPLVDTMKKYNINTPLRMQHFLAQVLHESGGFQFTKEQGNDAYFNKYEGRASLGNTQVGDGAKFKGRGLIQLTGRANYQKFKDDSGIDVIANPDLVANDPKLSAMASGFFWNSRNLNALADKDDVLGISKKINGVNRNTGLPNGLTDRQSYLAKAKSIISGLVDTATETVKKNPIIIASLTFGIIITTYILFKTITKNK
jgi:putative chitinase